MMNRRLCHALVIASMCWTGTACYASLDAEQTLTWDNAPAAPVFTEEEPVVDGDAASESEPLAASEVLPTITMAAPSSTPKGSPEAKAMMAAKLKKVTTYKQSKKVFQTMSMFVPIKIAWPPHIPTIENPCADDSCLNGGQCIPGEWRYRCECPRGYTGPRCEFELQQHHLTPSYHAALHPPAPIAPCGDGVCGEGEDGMNCIEDCDGIPGVLCAINDEIYNAVTDSYTAIRYHFDCDGTCRTDSALRRQLRL